MKGLLYSIDSKVADMTQLHYNTVSQVMQRSAVYIVNVSNKKIDRL